MTEISQEAVEAMLSDKSATAKAVKHRMGSGRYRALLIGALEAALPAIRAQVLAEVREALEKGERDAAALQQISAIRESIVAHQNINWSAHIYPLVAILKQAGIEAEGSIEEMQERYCAKDDRSYAPGEHPYCKLGIVLEERGLKRENNPLLRGACRCGHKVNDHNNVYGDRHCLAKDCDCTALATLNPNEGRGNVRDRN